jgi:hypothetical protein
MEPLQLAVTLLPVSWVQIFSSPFSYQTLYVLLLEKERERLSLTPAFFADIHINGVRLCLLTAATNSSIVHSPGDT